MKEIKTDPGYDWDAWFWLDKEEFEGEWKIGQCRFRIEKAVGRDDHGRLFLMVWTNHDKYDWHKFTQVFFEIDHNEYLSLLDRAISQGEVESDKRQNLIAKEAEPFIPPWDISKDIEIYRDERYTLGQKGGEPYMTAAGERYKLACHPYEPCLYITDKNGSMSAVHNAFDPFSVLESFSRGETITSITGFEYDAKDFCKMVEYAANRVDIQIDEAERCFNGRPKSKMQKTADGKKNAADSINHSVEAPECDSEIISNDPFFDVIARYPDCVIDYCIVKNEHRFIGYDAHRMALVRTCGYMFTDESEEAIRHYDVGKADGKQISTNELFALAQRDGKLNYRKAFLNPPHTNGYIDADFDRVNAALFPNGTDALEIYEWTTDWSEYFDEGHEWWGALCITVYDKRLDRFAVILASATD